MQAPLGHRIALTRPIPFTFQSYALFEPGKCTCVASLKFNRTHTVPAASGAAVCPIQGDSLQYVSDPARGLLSLYSARPEAAYRGDVLAARYCRDLQDELAFLTVPELAEQPLYLQHEGGMPLGRRRPEEQRTSRI